MNETRSEAACVIYEENIVVSGGYHRWNLNTVESYDVFGNIWTPMPSMIERRYGHSLVCVKSKLIAVGGTFLNTNCEVFDKLSYKFVALETPKFSSCLVQAVSIGSKIFVFQNFTKVVLCYDVDKDEWSEESFKATENIRYYSTVKMVLY